MMSFQRNYFITRIFIWICCVVVYMQATAQHKYQQKLIDYLDKTNLYESYLLDSLKSWTSKGMREARLLNDSLAICGLHLNLSYALEYHSLYPDALQENFKALRIAEKLHNQTYEISIYGFQSVIYGGMNENKLAIVAGEKAVKKAEELRLNTHLTYSYLNLARIYLEDKNKANFNRIQDLLGSADSIVKETNDTINKTVLYGLLGSMYSQQGKCEKALEYKKLALDLCSPNEVYNKIILNIYIAKIYTECFNKPELSLPYLNKALEMNSTLNSSIEFRDCYEQLAIVHQLLGNYKEAYEYNLKYHAINDSLLSNDKQIAINRITKEFDAEKKLRAIESLEAEGKLNKEEASKRKLLIWFLIGFIIVIILLLFFVQRAYWARKRHTIFLSEENERKELIMQEVHHRVNNSLQMISSLLSLQAHNTPNDEVKEYLLKSEKRIHSMSAMHELLNENEGLLELDINEYLYRVIDFHKSILESREQIRIIAEIPHIKFPTKIALPLALIVNELITNALKYAFPNSSTGVITIILQSIDEECKWKLLVKDNGIGLPDNHNDRRVGKMGIRIIHILTKQIGAQSVFRNESGTLFEMYFLQSIE